MYLTNDERIRLGLQSYGSDVPADVVAAAEEALAAACGLVGTASTPPATKTRARGKAGKYQGDDPTTTETNEAFVDEGL